jgi:hypothetical protein
MHLFKERGDRGVGFPGGVCGNLHRLALGGGGGFAGFLDGWIGVGFRHGFADALLFVWAQAGELADAIVGLLTIGFTLTRGITAWLGFRLTVAFFASATRLGIGLSIAAFTLTGGLAAGLGFGLAVAFTEASRLFIGLATFLVWLALFHGPADFFKNRGHLGVGLTGGFFRDFVGLLLGFGGGLLGLAGLFAGFLDGWVLVGLLHRFMQALLFVRGELDGKAWDGAAFGGWSVGADVRARGVFGRKAEGGEEEQG